MRILELNIQNYRVFDEARFIFQPNLTIIAGVNGRGKTSILEAIALIQSRLSPEISPARSGYGRIANEAAGCGFFSIWMEAFEGIPAVRQALINAFGHTAADCFDVNTDPISPRPANTLQNSGKS